MLATVLLSLSFVGFLKSLIMVFCWLSALLLIVVVLLQEPKGGGLASAFGGAGAETFGVQTGGVNKFTTYLAGFFLLMAVLYAGIRIDDTAAPSMRPDAGFVTPGPGGNNGGNNAGDANDKPAGEPADKPADQAPADGANK